MATLYCFAHALVFIWVEVLLTNSLLDLFLPVTLIRWMLGEWGRGWGRGWVGGGVGGCGSGWVGVGGSVGR